MAKKTDEDEVDEEETDEESASDGDDASDEGDVDASGDDDAAEADPVALEKGASTTIVLRGGEADALVSAAGAEGEEEAAAAQLGTARWVLAAFFAAGLLGSYVLGRTLEAVWASLANRDWFSQTLPRIAAVGDEKTTYCFIVSGITAVIVVLRAYRRPDVRTWADEVAGELAKVKWPSRKEVYNSTFIVIVASAAATLYLALLDRLWAFVTNIVYGDGS